MATEQYPLQRFFGVQPGERQQDQLAGFEARLATLEASQALGGSQTGDAQVTDVLNLAHNTSTLDPALSVQPIRILDANQIMLVYYEVDVTPFASSVNSVFLPLMYIEPVGGGAGLTVPMGRFVGATTPRTLVPISRDFNTGTAGGASPRGSQATVANLGMYFDSSLQLRCKMYLQYTDPTTPGSVLVTTRRYLSVQVL